MDENLHRGFIVKQEVDILVSPQALKILGFTKYTKEEFVDWMIKTRKISFGGGDVVTFLENMKEETKDGSSIS